MFRRLLKTLVTSFLSGAVLLAIGLVIWYVRQGSKTTLQDTYFWVGAIPIAIVSISQFGKFFGRGDATYQLSRSVSHQSATERAAQDESDLRKNVTAGLNWILAGLWVWFISYFM
jgi:hypothetical protein